MFQAILFLYSILYLFFLVLYLPAVVFESVFRKKKTQIFNRIISRFPADKTGQNIRIIWIHAVSVGEVNAALGLIRKLVKEDYKVFLSTTTVTGQQIARSSAGSSVTLLYFPLDFKIICRLFIKKINPDVIALMETEIWPNFLEVARREKVPVIFINGRISDNSFKNYLRISPLIRPLFNRITTMCMQSDIDAERIKEIGAAADLLRVTGNMKFDYSLEIPAEKRLLQEQISSLLLQNQDSKLWICGSTKPNEEEILSYIYRNLKKEFSGLKLLIAPRHPHRGEEVAGIFKSRGIRTMQRTLIDLNNADLNKENDVLVLDTVGELAFLYEIADIVFMGGSLVPTGGQNVIEPAFFGKPIIFGPSMTNFREIAELFLERKAAVRVQSPQELEMQIRKLLPDEAERLALGGNARQVIENNRGAVDRNLEVIKSIVT
jgi:3-deoxy-D-manno-octulosonic-acid transferase